jgi:catechol 2,3-dioxygenase-like lactoylglutathione lyase family enzyme
VTGELAQNHQPAQNQQPTLSQLNMVVRDMDATLAFYRRLGFVIEAESGASHVELPLPNGLVVEFDDAESVAMWHSGWPGITSRPGNTSGPGNTGGPGDTGGQLSTGGGIVLGVTLSAREAVDAIYAEVTAAGYAGRQPPYDAFWGSRYAVVEDPDGQQVGLMSPIDDSRKTWPPVPPPRAS